MAGVYPDVPDHRMAYDRDGSVLVRVDLAGGTATQLGAADVANYNDEDSDGLRLVNTQGADMALVFIFPEQRDFVAYMHQGSVTVSSGGYGALQWSNDTTNGIDGSWTNILSPWVNSFNSGDISREIARNSIQAVAANNVKAIRFRFTSGVSGGQDWTPRLLHLYGRPASGQAPNRLRIWHPTLDQEVGGAYFDWGDVSRSTIISRDFRVKNPSGTLTANSIVLTTEALSDTVPSNVSQFEFSTDGSNWFSSLNIGSLGPGSVSPVITRRRVTTADAVLSLWWTRMIASAASYT